MEQNTTEIKRLARERSKKHWMKYTIFFMGVLWVIMFCKSPQAAMASDINGILFQSSGYLLLLHAIAFLIDGNKDLEAKVEKFDSALRERVNKVFRIKS